MGRLISLLLVIWLVIGAFAAYQRGYFESTEANCSEVSDTLLTVAAGPLNYFGVNPKVDCEDIDVEVPQPSE